MKSASELIDLLTLERIEDKIFRGQNYVTPWKRIFGGQVLAQSLSAAYQTVPEDRFVHSMHGYFILTGDVNVPVIYSVETIRDGGSFTTRRVTAIQKGRPIFVMACSFQLKQEGFDHQNEMPDVDGPEGLLTDIEQGEQIQKFMPDVAKKIFARKQGALEFRPVEKTVFENAFAGKKHRHVWMKLKSEEKLSIAQQHVLLAYASDYDLLLTSVYPHHSKVNVNELFIASLDHAMWFHRDLDFTDWMLYSIDSPSASNSRGMGYGRIFDRQGRLVSTVMQEGLIRNSRKV